MPVSRASRDVTAQIPYVPCTMTKDIGIKIGVERDRWTQIKQEIRCLIHKHLDRRKWNEQVPEKKEAFIKEASKIQEIRRCEGAWAAVQYAKTSLVRFPATNISTGSLNNIPEQVPSPKHEAEDDLVALTHRATTKPIEQTDHHYSPSTRAFINLAIFLAKLDERLDITIPQLVGAGIYNQTLLFDAITMDPGRRQRFFDEDVRMPRLYYRILINSLKQKGYLKDA